MARMYPMHPFPSRSQIFPRRDRICVKEDKVQRLTLPITIFRPRHAPAPGKALLTRHGDNLLFCHFHISKGDTNRCHSTCSFSLLMPQFLFASLHVFAKASLYLIDLFCRSASTILGSASVNPASAM